MTDKENIEEDEGDDPIWFRLAEAANKGFIEFKKTVEQDETVRQWLLGRDYGTYAEWFFYHYVHQKTAGDDD